jgi:outer membrane protein assembly factor BamB
LSATTTSRGARPIHPLLAFVVLTLAACSTHPRLESGDPLIEAGKPGQREVWRRDVGRALQLAPVPVGDDWIIAPTEGSLYRLKGKNGDELWRRKLRSGAASPPVVCGDMLVVSTDVSQAEVLGIALADGTVKWKWGHSIGYLAALDSVVVFAGRGGRILAFDPKNGSVKWELSRPGSGWRAPATDRTRGLVFVPIRPDSLLALNGDGTVRWIEKVGSWPHVVAAPSGLIVSTDDSTLVRMDPENGQEKARRSLQVIAAGDPVVHENVVYLALRNGGLLTVDAETLADRWITRFESPLVSAPLVGSDFIAQSGTRGRIYLVSETGAPLDTLHHPEALEATPSGDLGRLAVGGMGGTLVLFRKQSE